MDEKACLGGVVLPEGLKGLYSDFGYWISDLKAMAIYFFFVLFCKYVHADVSRAATFYRWALLAVLIAFAAFMWILDIKLIMDS